MPRYRPRRPAPRAWDRIEPLIVNASDDLVRLCEVLETIRARVSEVMGIPPGYFERRPFKNTMMQRGDSK